MTLYIILIFIALCAGMAISVHAFGTGGKRKRIFQDIYFTVEDVDGIGVLYTKTGEYSAVLRMGEPRAEVFGQHQQLLRVHKPAHRRRTDAGRRLCDSQAGRVRAQAVRGCDRRPARVPILRLFPVLQRPDVHGQRMLPDHYAGIKKKQPVLFRRQEVARLPREDTQGA